MPANTRGTSAVGHTARAIFAIPGITLGPGPVGFGADAGAASAGERCAAAKIGVAGRAVFDKAKCQQKALLSATVVDPACLAKVQSRFASAIAKADLLGSCPGTTAEVAGDVDACIASLASTITTPVSTTTSTTIGAGVETCCGGTSLCTQAMVAAPGDCSPFSDAAGPPGTVCDGTTGGCIAPPSTGGPCCQTDDVAGLSCLAGPTLNCPNCEALHGTFFASATCTLSGCVP